MWKGKIQNLVLRRDDNDGGDVLLPRELPEELVVEVELTLRRDVRVGHVEAVDEGEENRVFSGQCVHTKSGQIA